jgi:hypothetical protein
VPQEQAVVVGVVIPGPARSRSPIVVHGVIVACPIERQTTGDHCHSRTAASADHLRQSQQMQSQPSKPVPRFSGLALCLIQPVLRVFVSALGAVAELIQMTLTGQAPGKPSPASIIP